MTKDELLEELKKQEIISKYDSELAHSNADDLLLKYINDFEIKKAFAAIDKWYA